MKKYKYLFRAKTVLFASIALVFVYSGLNFAFSPNVSAYTDVAALTDVQRTLCVDTNGNVLYVGSELNCVCPTETIWTSDKGCRTEGQLCSDTNGDWKYDGISQRCICPSGFTIFAKRCQQNNQSGGDTIDGGNTIDDSGGQGVSREELGEGECDVDPGTALDTGNCGIIRIIVYGINFLAAIAGIAMVASLMIAGFQYMTAQDNASQIQKAKSRIFQTLIALALFIFMYAFLNFLVPGGVL